MIAWPALADLLCTQCRDSGECQTHPLPSYSTYQIELTRWIEERRTVAECWQKKDVTTSQIGTADLIFSKSNDSCIRSTLSVLFQISKPLHVESFPSTHWSSLYSLHTKNSVWQIPNRSWKITKTLSQLFQVQIEDQNSPPAIVRNKLHSVLPEF